VVFENGHCLLPKQANLDDYNSILDDDIRAIAGKFLSVHDTNIQIHPIDVTASTMDQQGMTLQMENICGGFRGSFENVVGAGVLMTRGAPRVAQYVKHRQFVGTHYLFHTVHGRLAYRVEKKMWGFKGCRSVQDLVGFIRDLAQDKESDMYPVVSMLSVTLRTDTALVIDPSNSLMQRVLERLYSHVVQIQPRLDDINNLFFMRVVDWKELLKVVENDKCRGMERSTGDVVDTDVDCVRGYMQRYPNDPTAHPTASIGYTRKGVFFIRITFPRGCVCNVEGSLGMVNGKVPRTPHHTVCVGGIEPFVQVVTRFVVLVLVKMRVVGVL
jgi:hypothetical protein